MPRIEHKIENNIESKYCGHCKIYKALINFGNSSTTWDTLRPTCKDCLKQGNVENKDKRTEYNKKYWEETKDTQKEKNKIWREENKEYVKEKMQDWLESNKERKKQTDKEYRIKNWDKKKEYNRNWRKADYDSMKNDSSRIDEFALYKIKSNTSRRIREMLGQQKSKKTMDYVGIKLDKFKEYLEFQFTEGMSWDNYGETIDKDKKNAWHIDHILPCNAFDFNNEMHVKACFYYENLRPFWATENIIKKDKYDVNEFNKYIEQFKKKKIKQTIV